jgi:hypothetical protein
VRNLTTAGNPAKIRTTNMLVVGGCWTVVILKAEPDVITANVEVMPLLWLHTA